MKSPYTNLFLAIQERIQDEVPEIQYIDQNMGQYMNEEFRKQMLFPCLLIDFPMTDFSALQGNSQMGDATIVVTLFHDIWNNTNNLTPSDVREAGLTYLEIDQKVFVALQGWSPDFCEPLIRTHNKSHNSNDVGLMVRETQFRTTFEDYSCADKTPRIQLGLRTE